MHRNKAPAPPMPQDLLAEEEDVAMENPVEQVSLRPDGYHWVAPDGKQEFGPFETLEEALADMAEADGLEPEPGETLQEAENEIGIADWIDPDTGEPAEGLSPPRFEDH
jgi:hypothetical protein